MIERLENPTDHNAVEDLTREIAEYIAQVIIEARDHLLAQRDGQIKAANALLDSETKLLLEEHGAISQAAQSLAALLPAQAREAERQADVLLLAGKREEAQLKIREQHEAEAGPATMAARQKAISLRLDAIGGEKKAIAKRAFEVWYPNLQALIRACERGLFVDLLDSGLAEMRSYQDRHGLTGTLADPFGFLVKNFHIENLTADQRSSEWRSASQWYGVRR